MIFVVKCGVRRLKVVCSRQEVGVFGECKETVREVAIFDTQAEYGVEL